MAGEKIRSTRETLDFVFLSGNTALDFVNTRPVLRGQPVELLKDFTSVLRWFVAAKLLDQKVAAKFRDRWANTREAVACWRQMLHFREQLRRAILSLESGKTLSRKMLDELNHLLALHPVSIRLVAVNGTLKKEHRFEPRNPADLLVPLLNAAADFFANLDTRRLRRCESCVLHFHDTTKNATRRWCSMKLCGNRAKVGKYAARRRRRIAAAQ